MQHNSIRKPYNGIPPADGEILVPMVVDDAFIATHEISRDRIRVWHMPGVEYKVVFYAVPEEARDLAMESYHAQVNELLDEKLGPNRSSRCLIPQEDGGLKPCPKKRANNHPACKDCPNYGMLEREDKSTVSIEGLSDEFDLDAPAIDNTELDSLLPLMLEELIADLKDRDTRTYKVLMLCYDSMNEEDAVPAIMEKFNLKRSRAYDLYNDAKKLIKNLMY